MKYMSFPLDQCIRSDDGHKANFFGLPLRFTTLNARLLFVLVSFQFSNVTTITYLPFTGR